MSKREMTTEEHDALHVEMDAELRGRDWLMVAMWAHEAGQSSALSAEDILDLSKPDTMDLADIHQRLQLTDRFLSLGTYALSIHEALKREGEK